MFYCEKIENNKILNYTESLKIAKSLGWTVEIREDDIEQSYDGFLYVKGHAPEKPEPTIEEQNEAIRQTREQLYVQTSDKLKADYDEAVARGAENAEELKTAWLESKDKIREENPYIVESVEESEVI